MPFRLQRYLAAQLAPLAVLLVVVTCLSAPVAFYVLGRRALRVQAQATANQVAALMLRDAQQRPRLWKYDSIKLLRHIRAYEVVEGIRVEVVDRSGMRIDHEGRDDHETTTLPWIWAHAPLRLHQEEIGAVWVGATLTKLRRDALLLLLGFSALGSLLGGLMYVLPMRAVGRAESELSRVVSRLEASQADLAALNENLEHQVEARSSELARAYDDLRELSARAVALQESERRGIARELHDSAGQSLTAIRIHLQLMTELLRGKGEATLVDNAERITSMVDEIVEEIRRAVNRLGPAVLDDVGLLKAIGRAAEDLAEATELDVRTELDIPEGLDASLEVTCYRVVQEALTNVARHAQAHMVRVSVVAEAGALEVAIVDDGVGFERQAVRAGSRGLLGMRERMELVGGTLQIDAKPGQGTQIRARIPIRREPDDS